MRRNGCTGHGGQLVVSGIGPAMSDARRCRVNADETGWFNPVARDFRPRCRVNRPAAVVAATVTDRRWWQTDVVEGSTFSAVTVLGAVSDAATTAVAPQAMAEAVTAAVIGRTSADRPNTMLLSM
jgi:hypothetical protein